MWASVGASPTLKGQPDIEDFKAGSTGEKLKSTHRIILIQGLRNTTLWVYVEPRIIPLVTGGDRFPAWLVKKTPPSIHPFICEKQTVAPAQMRLRTKADGGKGVPVGQGSEEIVQLRTPKRKNFHALRNHRQTGFFQPIHLLSG
jgi:hypothetical protein